MPRIRAWHATAVEFETFAPFSHFGSRAQAEMRCPPRGWLLEVEILVTDPLVMKDHGSWNLAQLKRIAKKGYDSISYLNRFEGIPLEAFERARAQFKDIDRLTDDQFRRAIPEAADSWIIFNPTFVTIVGMHQRKPI